MKFSKLRLIGFKSFVDPVELTILPGLTGVVGPNGCGKSNLLEALRWVMGENRPTSVRGDAMEDVIFAGAGTRAPKNYAEVTLGLEAVSTSASPNMNENGNVNVVRRVTRDIGSSFRVNGKDARAKDVHMLFADSSTGSHSPSLVRQGQISELINANPKSRRRLLEEAAGISGLYQRRHEAELKLKSSESNMERLQDVIEQLEYQLKALEKQARQASKYKELANRIRDNERFLFCKKFIESDKTVQSSSDELMQVTKMSVAAQVEVSLAWKKRDEVETKLPELRNEEAKSAAGLQRSIIERDSIKKEQERAESNILELRNRGEEVSKDYDRQGFLVRDAGGVIERLLWELEQLENLSEGYDEKVLQAKNETETSAQGLTGDENELDTISEDFARLAARHQSIERQLDNANNDLERAVFDLERAEEVLRSLKIEQIEKSELQKEATSSFEKCKFESETAEESLKATELIRSKTAMIESQKRVEFSTVKGRLAALRAERHALQGLILALTDGSKQIFDQVRIEKGFEAALGVAIGDDFKAPVIFSNNISGWYELSDLNIKPLLPEGVLSIAEKVTAPKALSRRLLAIGLVDSENGPRLQKLLTPGQKLVSKEGNLWRWDGFCSISEDTLSEAALRLKQENRLNDLMVEIEQAELQVGSVESELTLVKVRSLQAEEADEGARIFRRNSDKEMSEASRMLSRVESDLSIITSKVYSLRENLILKQKEQEDIKNEIKELNEACDKLEELESKKHILEKHRLVVEESRASMLEKRAFYDQVRRDKESRVKRIEELGKESENWKNRLTGATESMSELNNRQNTLRVELDKAIMLPDILLVKQDQLVELVTSQELKKTETSEVLSYQESVFRNCVAEERESERRASEIREGVARAETLKDSAEVHLEELKKVIQEDMQKTPQELIATLTININDIPVIEEIEREILKLKNIRESLGAVNLRAEEDSLELAEEYNGLSKEKNDLEIAIKKLRSAIVTLNSEGRSRLLDAYTEVNKNFGELFQNLFGGGVAKLTLIESEDPLDAGLEIMCQPPGKKLSTLSLLSGGEQTLTALSLIFAVFRANPSPICVLDEVDAPLDDANVERFCGLLDEMTKTTDTRFMIITHHPLTMSRMDRLYGVTMVERGVSQLVSVDLKKAEQLLET